MITIDEMVKEILSQKQVSGHIRGKQCQIIIDTLQKKTNSVFISIIPAGDKDPIPTNIDELKFNADDEKNSGIRVLLKLEAIKKRRNQK